MRNETLIHARIRCGMSQKKLADELGVAEKTVSSWENSHRSPILAHRIRLAQLLQKSAEELGFNGEEEAVIQQEKPLEWQDLLATIIRNTAERQRIALHMGIKPETLIRWANRRTKPHVTHIRLLLDAVPQRRFQSLLEKNYPEIVKAPSLPLEIVPEIPSAFYSTIVSIHSSHSLLRFSTMRLAIFQQMLSHFDPLKQGLQVVVCLCVPPNTGEKVYSLRFLQGKSTAPWEHDAENFMTFLGLESQIGNTVLRGTAIVTQSLEDHKKWYPTHEIPFAKSIAAQSLISSDCIAGAIACFSTQENHFTSAHMELLRKYAELFVLTLQAEQFYPLPKIALRVMPPAQVQQPYLQTFQSHVIDIMLKSELSRQQIVHADAEQLAWKEIEADLLQLGSQRWQSNALMSRQHPTRDSDSS